MKRLLLLLVLAAGCSSVTGPQMDCRQVIVGKLVGVLNFADGRKVELRAKPSVWADTITKCAVR